MSITFDLPPSVEKTLREALPNLDEAAKEIVLVALYRQGKLTQHELAAALGISRDAAEAVLKRHHVSEDLLTIGEFEQERAALKRSVKP